MAKAKSNIPIVFGAMTLGNGAEQSRVRDLDECGKILDIFQRHGHDTVDTARVYGEGSSEEYLGKLHWQDRGLVMDTKLYPTEERLQNGTGITHKPASLREQLLISLKALNADKVHMWYLHAPDRSTPYIDTLREVNNLHKEGYFEQFGISNYQAWEVAQIQEICRTNGWIAPAVYQGIYNCIQRAIEPELMACLRHYGMGFYAFNPLVGGFFVGHITRDSTIEEGSRFDPKKTQGQMYRKRYWHNEYFDAIEHVRPIAAAAGLTLAETALRWMTHHSKLSRDYQDAILIGASSTAHLEQNMVDLEKGPLPEDVVAALDKAWDMVKGVAAPYWH